MVTGTNNNTSGVGIQELMAAETRASHIVAGARTARRDRLKQAESDALNIIASYRKGKDEEFKKSYKNEGSSQQTQNLNKRTQIEVENMKSQFDKNKQKAINILLSKACEVSLEVPSARVRYTQATTL